jgi:predicted permease
MSIGRRFEAWLSWFPWYRRGARDADLERELRDHLELEAEEQTATGVAPKDGAYAAQRALGNTLKIEEDVRAVSGFQWLETLAQDLRYGLRILRKSPAFTSIAVLTLALGIGASTAVFSLVDAVLLKPLPFPQAERIVFLWRMVAPGRNLGYDKWPWARIDFLFFSRESKTFEDFGAFKSDSFNLTGSGEPVRLDGLRASAGFFSVLGVSPTLGRAFTDAEDRPGHEREVILSDALWRERFSADPSVLGRALELNGASYTVIGVMPQGFAFPRGNEMPASFTFAPRIQLWVPLALAQGPRLRGEGEDLAVMGRLKPGVTVAEVQAEVDVLGKLLEAQYLKFGPGGKGWFTYKVTLLTRQVAGDTRQPLLLILGAVGVVLLISCSNVASLLLTRFVARKPELSLRAALGAGDSRLIRQLLTESVVLAGAAGLVGILLAEFLVHFAKIFGPSSIPRLAEASINIRVFSFALAIALLTGIFFGLAPAIYAVRGNLAESLKEASRRSISSPAAQRARHFLVVSQIALALVLVIAATLLTRTFYHLLTWDPGFRPAHVLTFELSLTAARYPDEPHMVTLYEETLRRLQALPGVQSAAIAQVVPMGGADQSTVIRIPGRPLIYSAMPNYTVVSADYFSAVGTPILRGRPFLESDTADSLPVTIISDAMAKKYWPGEDALGKQVGPGGTQFPLATIVGIAADVKRLSLRDSPAPEMYVLYVQKVFPSLQTMDVILRTAADPASLAASARETVHSIDPGLPLANVKTLSEIVADSVTVPRFSVLLLGGFGALAVLLAAIGMYGVMSYSVAQRTQEIGIRMALGAQPRNVLQMVLGYGTGLAALGIGIGLAAAFGVTRLMKGFLYGVQPADPLTFTFVAVLLVIVALLACYIPARRAMKVDPIVALR